MCQTIIHYKIYNIPYTAFHHDCQIETFENKDHFQEELISVEKGYESLVVKEIKLKQKLQ